MLPTKLKAPFPYFGGKSKVAELVWDHIGDADNVIEPFAGSLAFLLARPHPPRVETVNDMDCMVANFWRATRHAPEAVAEHADNPVNECDLHARHRWLVLSEEAAAFRQRMRAEPDYYDPKIAGWWCWGLCCWIGSGWCTDPEWKQVPRLGDVGNGVCGVSGRVKGLREKAPTAQKGETGGRGVNGAGNRPQLADAFDIGRGVNSHGDLGTCDARRAWLVGWFKRLRDRMRLVRVCCGDWRRVCDSDSVTTRLGTTGIFFDPPYSAEAGRNNALYAHESTTVAHDVRAYCLERGGNPAFRIVLAGYEGEGHEELERNGWEAVAWKANGGYGNRSDKGKANAGRERLWVSPHCRRPAGLFDTHKGG